MQAWMFKLHRIPVCRTLPGDSMLEQQSHPKQTKELEAFLPNQMSL